MTDHPILMCGPMVKATREHRKTQTRRVVKLPDGTDRIHASLSVFIATSIERQPRPGATISPVPKVQQYVKCPYGKPGDRLWVREKWRLCDLHAPDLVAEHGGHGEHCMAIRYDADGQTVPLYVRPCSPADNPICLIEGAQEWCNDVYRKDRYWSRGRPSIHMPRWASRITLEVVSVRVERVQDISGEDAFAEGVPCSAWSHEDWIGSDAIPTSTLDRESYAIEEFAALWDSINAKRGFGWEANPWVWAVEFKVLA